MLFRRDNAERNRNDDFENKRNESQGEAVPDYVLELFGDRDCPDPALAEIALDGGFQPCEISLKNALVHTVLGVELGYPLVRALL